MTVTDYFNFLTLFSLGVGGGQKVPALTLNINDFFNIEANATKLSDFPKNYLATIWCDISWSKQLMLPWQPYFDRHVFRNFDFLAFLIRTFPFSLQFSHFFIILAFL